MYSINSNIRFKTKQKTGSSVISTPARMLYMYCTSEGVTYDAGMFLHDFSRKCAKPNTDVRSRKQMDMSVISKYTDEKTFGTVDSRFGLD
jgi:hypothetical protein